MMIDEWRAACVRATSHALVAIILRRKKGITEYMIALDWIAWAPPTFNFYLNKNGPFSLNFFSLKEKKRKAACSWWEKYLRHSLLLFYYNKE